MGADRGNARGLGRRRDVQARPLAAGPTPAPAKYTPIPQPHVNQNVGDADVRSGRNVGW